MTDAEQPSQPNIPAKGGLVTYVMVDGAVKAAEFYERAFGAERAFMYPADEQGRTMHIHLYVNGSSLMLGDFYPEHGFGVEKPQAFSLQLLVDDLDPWWARAVEAGAEVIMEPQVMFWGDRWGQLRDPFGVTWAINAPVKA
ncbi:glyoxalase/bleomycin resistance/extradiol dioxygenase family protein [Rhizobium rhizogenes]|uniref:VOC family protein n=1 Tax=Rhizobium rhizogenes TaxID=359 RepID=UPI000569DA5F|nr:glyoxalase/bleomycin resistance/extradiol dioxygenase family protein [Rhizobium rhizogenes]NTF84295.1 glyoxalase/bleomycin resistance/extradiol dioxygenase family protein [Rhizobium rhizogenes]NTH80278.1 glyoxalase/bleomycin resistance/extradiol dioxygenase family protein [Rhizobium rhizogenes]NTH86255.1 glyoxalase/bleomycin resistance/extradiol dioxygenase family protein [Rhizobium rhizogenes]NTI25453.1 glyoxalase/bleomycin resistance/extradiol dioxygenase family protein [Rhizobium rhizogen